MNQSYIPHLKVLVCGINSSSSQWCGYIFMLCYTHLKLALLLHKQGLVATGVGTTVKSEQKIPDTWKDSPLVENPYFCPIFIKLSENDCLMT